MGFAGRGLLVQLQWLFERAQHVWHIEHDEENIIRHPDIVYCIYQRREEAICVDVEKPVRRLTPGSNFINLLPHGPQEDSQERTWNCPEWAGSRRRRGGASQARDCPANRKRRAQGLRTRHLGRGVPIQGLNPTVLTHPCAGLKVDLGEGPAM